MNFWIETARRVHCLPENWEPCLLSCDPEFVPPGYTRIVGAVPIGTITRGPNKGRPKMPKERQTVFVSDAQVRETEQLFEQNTGKCHKCEGDGNEWCGWSRESGNRYRRCSRCDGTGRPPQAKEAGA